ncbi:MAG TPA: hypothetical protein VHD91_02940 [Gaiellaceae bacterium]|nr:hypothetical protein [Gaiellaceae bacterium]
MNEFVESCRREWKRLRVPSPVADDMAAELAADLADAAADGATLEDVLGPASSDARAFAAAWARERGVVGASRTPRGALAALVAVVLAAVIAGALLAVGHTKPSTHAPNLVGLSQAAAARRAAGAGLTLAVVHPKPFRSGTLTIESVSPSGTPTVAYSPTVTAGRSSSYTIIFSPTNTPGLPVGRIVAQLPSAGVRVRRGDSVQVILDSPFP